jgi:hypothetical protein
MTPESTNYHRKWESFAASLPHQAFLIHQLKSIHDNLFVVLRLLAEKQQQIDEPYFGRIPRHYDPDFSASDPFEYFENIHIDLNHRRIFLDLFVSLGTERKNSSRAVIWRELGRSILEHAYEAERAALVAELTSTASADALSEVYGPGKANPAAGIWSVRREIVVRENALQKALARLRELLKEGEGDAAGTSKSSSKKQTVKRLVEFERRRDPSRERVVERRRIGARSPERGVIGGPRILDDDFLPVRRRYRSKSPSVSEEESAEIVEL